LTSIQSDIQGRFSAHCRLKKVRSTASVETANVGKAFIIEGPKGPAGTVLQMHFANTIKEKKKKVATYQVSLFEN
jgi:hypothetical protein